ncbi:MAG: hypothetical protein HOO86_01995, partial [Bacteroidales bacterium]|nr:hypothetical protein [Bacteroidales bacterium]
IKTEQGEIDSLNLLKLINNHRKPFFIILLLTALLTFIFTGPRFITPLYKSTVILYPTASNSISKVLLSTNFTTNKDILEFGEDEQTERMLQILNSTKIRNRIIDKYNLMEHYSVNRDAKFRLTNLFDEYESKFKFRKTEYMAVKITVSDQDPVFAAKMANDVAELFDSTMNMMQKEVAIKAFRIVENEYTTLRSEVKAMEDSLDSLRRLGIHDYESQAEMINQQLAIELAKNNKNGIKALESKLEILAKYGGQYVSIRDNLEHERKQLSAIKAKYEEAKVDATQNLPHKFVVSEAFEAEKSSYPLRWLILLIAVFSTFVLLVIGLIILENLHLFELPKMIKTETIVPQIEIKQEIIAKLVVPQKHHNRINMENYFNNSSFIGLIIKWKIHLGIITIVAAILGAIFSGPTFITPLYKSEAIAYPANINSYSDESETEQMLQILQSQDIVDSMITKFNLVEHYKISPTYEFFKTALLQRFHENVKISKTPYEAISITVRDQNPETASNMAQEMLNLYNNKISNLHRSKRYEVVLMYENQLAKKRETIDSLKNRLFDLGTKYGLIDYSVQSSEVMRGYLRTMDGSNSGNVNIKGVAELKKNIESMGGELLILVSMLQNESRTYVDIKVLYEQEMRFYKSNLSYSNIISKPFPSDKKAFPVRWVIVALSSLGALLLAFMVIFIIENKQMIVNNDSSN